MASRLELGSDWQAWRIADGRFDPFSAIGAALVGGRWNSPGIGVIYASQSFAGTMLERLAHAGIGRLPKTQVAVCIHIPAEVVVEHLDEANSPPGWADPDQQVARAFGDAWLREQRTAVLRVPSVVARRESNVLLNPLHPDFKLISSDLPEPVVWDDRLFGRHRGVAGGDSRGLLADLDADKCAWPQTHI